MPVPSSELAPPAPSHPQASVSPPGNKGGWGNPPLRERHRVDLHRVPGFLSNRPNRVPPPLHQQENVACSPPIGSKGGHTRLLGRGCEKSGPNSDDGTDTVVLQVYYNPSTGWGVGESQFGRQENKPGTLYILCWQRMGKNGSKLYESEKCDILRSVLHL